LGQHHVAGTERVTIVLTINDTGVPKSTLVEGAYSVCGSEGYEFERTPEEVNSALRKLNVMMRQWPWNGLGFVQPDYGVGLPEDLSGVSDYAVEAITYELAVRIAPGMGASMSPEARSTRAASKVLVFGETATIPTMPYAQDTPRGAGNWWGQIDPYYHGRD
jgi:hypothetical protein